MLFTYNFCGIQFTFQDYGMTCVPFTFSRVCKISDYSNNNSTLFGAPMEWVSLDVLGPLPQSATRVLLVIIADYFMKINGLIHLQLVLDHDQEASQLVGV